MSYYELVTFYVVSINRFCSSFHVFLNIVHQRTEFNDVYVLVTRFRCNLQMYIKMLVGFVEHQII